MSSLLPKRLKFGAQMETNAAFVIPHYKDGDKIMVGFILRADGSFGFPGGKVEGDESLVDAAVRECLEEVGVAISKDFLKPVVSYRLYNGLGVHAYSYQLVSFSGDKSAKIWSRLSTAATHGHEHFGLVWVDVLNSPKFNRNQFASAVELEIAAFLRLQTELSECQK